MNTCYCTKKIHSLGLYSFFIFLFFFTIFKMGVPHVHKKWDKRWTNIRSSGNITFFEKRASYFIHRVNYFPRMEGPNYPTDIHTFIYNIHYTEVAHVPYVPIVPGVPKTPSGFHALCEHPQLSTIWRSDEESELFIVNATIFTKLWICSKR